MLFKLVSDGRTTHVEIDGKRLGSAVTGVSFSHTMNGKERDIRANIDLDLSDKGSEKGFIEDSMPGAFEAMTQRLEKLLAEEQQCKEAARTAEWECHKALESKEAAEACEAPTEGKRLVPESEVKGQVVTSGILS